MDDNALRADLLARIDARRAALRAFLWQNVPRSRRRMTAVVVLTSLAAVFTAGPAAGGTTFSRAVQNSLGLESDATVWRTLCLLAVIVSVAAAVLTNLNKSQDVAARVTAAEATSAELEGLATVVLYGQVPLADAVKLYQQYVAKVPFVTEAPAPYGGYPVPPVPPGPPVPPPPGR